MSIRKSVVSGSFYPDNKKELLDYFEKFNKTKDDKNSFFHLKVSFARARKVHNTVYFNRDKPIQLQILWEL